MSYREQKKYFEILKRYERKFDPREREDYKMLLKRHKDDEDLDKLSFERLETLYIKYHVNREKVNLDHLFKKPEDKSDE
ncbi:MAG: hypothetical protein ACOYVE_06065 [Melioribacter sp.]|uniref:hypothetical protein n=1 Tax=Melioribacter sp. TaxID=2052167 RepID=UPI003BCB4364